MSPIDPERTISEMLALAKKYGNAERLLSRSTMNTDPASSILGILRMEILLKAVYLAELKNLPHSHDYKKIWSALSQQSNSQIMCAAKRRVAGHADFSNFDFVLDSWRKVFVSARYGYERTMGETDTASAKRGKEWVKNGARPEEADFAYFPMELVGFSHGLLEFLTSRAQP